MSYVNKDSLKMTKRRHGIRRVTPEEAVEAANRTVDEANDKIARAVAFGQHWQQVATDLEKDNQAKDQHIAELKQQGEALEAEIERLRKKVVKKAGKRKGEEWNE